MLKHTYEDGSVAELYENGDLVEVINNQIGGLGAKVGEWGKVVLSGEDRKRGHSGIISHIAIQTAGVSTPKDSFQQCIASIPVWAVRPKNPADLENAKEVIL